jgi:hypothetical protein
VKKVIRSAAGAATLRLPVRPVGKAKKALLKNGKTKLRLTWKFLPTGGADEPCFGTEAHLRDWVRAFNKSVLIHLAPSEQSFTSCMSGPSVQ